MSDDWCEVMEMYRRSCAHCRPPAERRRLDALAVELDLKGGNTAPRRDVGGVSPAFYGPLIAEHSGKCEAECGDAIATGDEITRYSKGWAHHRCVYLG
ncbi:MAG TPA: hypothetical protein VF516_35030 [Kofleriaceae bacterium]